MDQVKISFVIPALNEAHNIGNTLESIQSAVKNSLISRYEVIVVDHGSSDGTAEVAREHGALVITQHGGTIAQLRNIGAAQALGEILVFIDADVTLTSEWSRNIVAATDSILRGSRLITGSHCAPPESENLLLKYWFSGLASDPRNTHVGTGHMIISRHDFKQLNGFDSNLRTGEDYEFCERARKFGYSVSNNPALKVVHHDFPTTLNAFVKREAWHGAGDLSSIAASLNSKVVIASIVFLAIHLAIIGSVLVASKSLAAVSLASLMALLLMSAYAKNRHTNALTVLINAAIFYFYYSGRSLALLRKLINPLRN